MLVESFYENVERDGRNAVLHFVPRPAGTMLVACLFAQWTDPRAASRCCRSLQSPMTLRPKLLRRATTG